MNTNKILIIGQAPPVVKQELPYDTTMLYDWLNEVGISKEKAQEIFEFEAMTNTFPGFEEHGGHKKPSQQEMYKHLIDVLITKINACQKVILLGRVPQDFFHNNAGFIWNHIPEETRYLSLIHPSKRNYSLYQKNKQEILSKLKSFITL